MALDKGELDNVRESLSNALDDALTEDQRDRLSRAFPEAARDEYESAGEAKDEQAKLVAAAEKGGVDEAYGRFYRQNPDIRASLSEAVSNAFDQSARDAIKNAYDNMGVSEAYSHCSRGNFGDAARAIGLQTGEINASSANECRNQVQMKSGIAEDLFNAFQDSESNATYTP